MVLFSSLFPFTYSMCIDGLKNVMAHISGGKKGWPLNSASSLLWVLLMPVSVEAQTSVIPATQKKCPIGGHHLSKLGGGWGKARRKAYVAVRREFTLLAQCCPWEPFRQKWKCGRKQASVASMFYFGFPGGVGAQVLPTAEDKENNAAKALCFYCHHCVVLANECLGILFLRSSPVSVR